MAEEFDEDGIENEELYEANEDHGEYAEDENGAEGGNYPPDETDNAEEYPHKGESTNEIGSPDENPETYDGGEADITDEKSQAVNEENEDVPTDLIPSTPHSRKIQTANSEMSFGMSSVDSPLGSPGSPGSFDGYDEYGEGYGDEDYGDEEYYDDEEYGEWEEGEIEEGKPKRKGPKNILGDNFLDFTWKKPEKELAEKRGKAGLWQGGERTFAETSVSDFGEMSDGMELYFYVLRAFAGLFFVLSLLSIPLLVIAAAGNGNLAIDPIEGFPATFTLGNAGYNPDAAKAAGFCRDQEGDNRCVATRYLFGLEIAAKYVTFVISGYEALISVVMIVVSTYLVMRIEQKAEEIDDDSSTPADFTVFVRNLPKDVSEGALVAHFSMRYALAYEQPEFPVLGLSAFGACFTLGFFAALLFSVAAGSSLTSVVGSLGPLASPVVLLWLTSMFTVALWVCGVGQPRDRLTPGQRWDEMDEARNEHRAYMAEEREQYRLWEEAERAEHRKSQRSTVKPGQVVPILEIEEEPTQANGDVKIEEDENKIEAGEGLVAAEAGEEEEEGVEMEDKGYVDGGAPSEEVADETFDQNYSEGDEPQPFAEAVAETEPQPYSEGAAESEPQPDSEGAAESEPQPYAEAVAESEPQPYSEVAAESEPPPYSEVAVESEPQPYSEGEAGVTNPEGTLTTVENVAKPQGEAEDEFDDDFDVGPRKRCGCCGCCCCANNKLTPEEAFKGMDMDGLSPDLPRPDPQPVASCLHNGYPPVLGSWVADLHIVYPNGSIISSYLKQRALMGKIQGMRSKIQQFKEDTPYEKGANPKKVEKFTKKLEKLQKKMEKVHAKVAKKIKDSRTAANCEGCFITFNHEESQQRCLEDYRASSSWYGRLFQPRHLRFMWHTEDPNTGVKKQSLTSIRVEQAPEPSDIFWEKLHVTDTSRLLRVIGSNIVTFIVLVLSFVVALTASSQTAIANESISSTDNCNLLPSIWYGQFYNHTVGDLWDTTATTWVRNHTYDTTICGGKGTYIVNTEFEQTLDYENLPSFRAAPFNQDKVSTAKIARPQHRTPANYVEGVDIDGKTLCDDVCHYSGAAAPNYVNRTGCISLSCNPGLENWVKEGYPCFQGSTFYPPSAVANCYCKQLYESNFGSLPAEDKDLCQEFYTVLNNANFYSIMSVLTVVVVNGAALPIIKAMVAFEKQVSVSAEKKALVSKMFSLQFLNTAVITLMVNTAYNGRINLGPLKTTFGVGAGEYDDFSMDWYINVGAGLCTTMLIQAFSPHIATIAKSFVVGPLKRKFLSGSASTQEQLDDLYEGENFEIEARSAFTGVALVVSMMYNAGMPLLTLFGFINFSLSFVVDKYLLIKKYAQPPMYGPAVPKVLVNLLPIGTFIHMGVGLYMLSNDDILYGPDVTRDAEDEAEPTSRQHEMLQLVVPRIVRMHTLCMFFLFGAYTGLFVLYGFGLLDEFAEECGKFTEKLYARCCGSKLAKQAAAARSLDHPEPPRPAYCDEYVANLTKAQKVMFEKTGKLSKSDRRRGYKLIGSDGKKVKKLHVKEGEVNGVKKKKGEPKFTWEHIKDTTSYTYDIGMIRKYKAALNGIKSNNLPNPSRRSRLEDTDKEDRYAITLENIGSLTEIVYDTEEEKEEEVVAPEMGDEEGREAGEGLEGQAPVIEDGQGVVTEGEEEGIEASEVTAVEELADQPPKDGGDETQLPIDGTDADLAVEESENKPDEEADVEEEEPEPEMSEEEKAAAKEQEELLAKLAAEEAEMLAKLAEEEAARQAEEEAAAAKLAEEEAARVAQEAEAAAKAAEEEAARQAADAAAKARAEEEAEYARQKALAKEEAEKQAAFEAEEAERLREEAEAAENMVIEVDDDAEEL